MTLFTRSQSSRVSAAHGAKGGTRVSDRAVGGVVFVGLIVLLLELGVFVAASLAARALPESVTTHYPWARQAVVQGLMAAVALGAMAASGRLFAGCDIASVVVVVVSVTALGYV